MTETAAVQSWLTERIAEYTQTDAATIEPDVPLATYGLDSVIAVTLIVDIEDRYGLVLDADALWEHRTVGLLAELIATRLNVEVR
jgi:acyl carrier protein